MPVTASTMLAGRIYQWNYFLFLGAFTQCPLR
ncbi:hypothetical protein FHS43_000605 [Streptosporangium becharense]|uniref:Uncharacterized protein n=1 Tax=Streptosporangium becharense TaxID=1816182 RepID=A0A7W9IGK3_9ACTN|nr:hypothetical protein [Streptosporangium becharense]MBB5819684.1 hypothetical protein [Streptosporangium becharense]